MALRQWWVHQGTKTLSQELVKGSEVQSMDSTCLSVSIE